MNWTQRIKQLQREGRATYTPPVRKQLKPRKIPAPSAEKAFISLFLKSWTQQRGYRLTTEYRFDPVRRWEFDWCIPELKIAVEYEGLFSLKSGHTTAQGYTADTEKYNEAGLQGWRVLRYTALSYRTITETFKKYDHKLKT